MANHKRTLVLEKRVKCGVTAPPVYLTGLDIFHSYAHFPVLLVYKKALDLEKVEKALVETLSKYPIIAGRFKKDKEGHVYVDMCDGGVDWRLHKWDCPLPYGEDNPVGKDFSKHFYRLVMPWKMVDKDEALMQINIHQFSDGSTILCCGGPHALVDGCSFWFIMLEWAKACHGMPVYQPATFSRDLVRDNGKGVVVPEGTYDLLEAPSIPKLIWTFLRLGWQTLRFKSVLLRVPKATIDKWQAEAVAQNPGSKPPSNTSLVQLYVLRAISPELPAGVDRSIGIVRDMRFTPGTGVPLEFIGNAVCYAEARYTPEELARDSLGALAHRCKPPAEQVSGMAIVKMFQKMEAYRQKKANWRLIFKPTLETLKAGVIVNPCMKLPIYDMDMGAGAPVWFEMMPPTIRLMLLVPTPRRDGSIDILMGGHSRELEALRRRFEADGIDTRVASPKAA